MVEGIEGGAKWFKHVECKDGRDETKSVLIDSGCVGARNELYEAKLILEERVHDSQRNGESNG